MAFDEARLDDPAVLGAADLRLRALAETGARIRQEVHAADELLSSGVARLAGRPRAIVLIGSEAHMLSLALTSVATVPVVFWTSSGLPSWIGSLDLLIVVAPHGGDPSTTLAIAEASRRGCRVIAAAPAGSIVAEHVTGADSACVTVHSTDSLAISVALVVLLGALDVAPSAPLLDGMGTEEIAQAVDSVAVDCSPRREFSVNPGKLWAIALGDTVPLVWGGSLLANAAAEGTADAFRRATGRPALAGHADVLIPLVEAAPVASIFDDPVEDGGPAQPSVVLLDDGVDHVDPDRWVRGRRALVGAADARNVRVEVLEAHSGGALGRYAQLVLSGQYAAEYLRLGQSP